MLQVDADSLHYLGELLNTFAGGIKDIKHAAAVAMPNSPVGDAAVESSNTVLGAYLHIGGNVSRMAEAASTSATSYESVDAAFSGDLKAYEAGQ